ncbi:MAG: ABC transporter permease [Lachnospiraceae bacterium]|nr:ABC transporter permease [Lachnospiraceae bacterium]
MNKRSLWSGPYILWMIGFTVIPFCMILHYALTDRDGAFTFRNLLAMFEPVHLKAMTVSVEVAFFCTVICILLAYPLVIAMKRLGLFGKSYTILVLILPMWINFILRLLALQMILSNNGVLNHIFSILGLPPHELANTRTAMMIGIVYDYLPYMIVSIYNSVADIDDDIIEAARDLGAGSLTVFFRIILPLSVPGLLSGIVMVFVPSMTSFVTANIMAGGKIQLIGNIIEQEFITTMDWHLGSGLSVILMIFVLLSMAFTSRNDPDYGMSKIW